MKIRDLDQYAKLISGDDQYRNKFDTLEYSFFKELYGGTFNIESRISEISDFAANANEQIFYEFLQNANDAGASSFFVAFDESNFLVVNNGQPFLTDGKGQETSRFRTFLTKKQSANFGNENIGEKGQGSKLLYELITDNLGTQATGDALIQEIYHHKKGPIILSWENTPLQYFMNWVDTPFQPVDCLKTGNTLLAKIIHTYFPVMPSNEASSLFSMKEMERMLSFLREHAALMNVADFVRGTLLYFPLGKGRYQAIKTALEEGNLTRGLSTSLALLGNVQRVKINDLLIQRPHDLQGRVISARKETSADGKERTINTRLFLPKSPQTLGNTYNFFQFFPIVEENHGLKFIIDSKEYKIEASRQKIDLSKVYNERKLEEISQAIIGHYVKLVEANNIDQAIHFIKCILLTDLAVLQNEVYKKLFYDDLIAAIKTKLPTHENEFSNSEKVVVKDSNLLLHPRDIGQSGIYWLHPDLRDYYDLAKERLEIAIWKAKDILKNCADEKRKEWVNNLAKADYQQLVKEIVSENTRAGIKGIPFIKATNGELYALSDFERVVSKEQNREEDSLILLEKRTQRLATIFKKQEILVGGTELLGAVFWETFIERNFEVEDTALFEKINKSINATTLNRDDKWTIFTNYQIAFEGVSESQLRSELQLFANRDQQIKPLRKLLKNSSTLAQSGLLESYQIHPVEVWHHELDSYLMQPNRIWNNVVKDWEIIQPKLNGINYKMLLNDCGTLYDGSSGAKKLGSEKAWILVAPNEWIKPEDLFYSQKILGLSETEYNNLKAVVERISSFKMVAFDFIKYLQYDCFDILPKSLENLSEKITEDSSPISKEELAILQKIRLNNNEGFFTSFTVQEEENGYVLQQNNGKKQFHSIDNLLNTFLADKSNFQLLPSDLLSIFQNDIALEKIDGSFVQDLVEAFGGDRALINVVSRESNNIKQQYLNKIDEIVLSPNGHTTSYRDEFEGKVLALVNQTNSQQAFKEKIFIGEQLLSDFIYRDEVTIALSEENRIRFSLAKLIEKGDSQILESVKDKLSSAQRGSLFDMKDYPIADIADTFTNISELSCYKLAFLIAYDQSLEQDDTSLREKIKAFEAAGTDEVDLLEILFKKSIPNFSPYLSDSFFHPEWYIFSDRDNLLLAKEKLPDSILSWLGEGDMGVKLSFLEKNGLQKDGDAVIEFRDKFNQQKYTNPDSIKKVIQNKYLANNTLEWVAQNYKDLFPKGERAYSSVAGLVERFIKQYNQLPHRLIQIVKFSADETFDCQLIDWQNRTDLYGLARIKKEEGVLIEAISRDLGIGIVDVTSHKCLEVLKGNGIPACRLERTIKTMPDDTPEEWAATFYQEWKRAIGERYQIELLANKIPFNYTFKYGTEEMQLAEPILSTFALEEKNGYNRILLKARGDDEILDLLADYQDDLFKGKEKEQLVKLLNLARKAKIVDNLRAELEEVGITDEYLDILKRAVENKELTAQQLGDLLNSEGDNLGKGRVDLGRELTEMQLSKLRENIDTVLELLERIDREKLEAILKHLGDIEQLLEEEIDKSTPNQIIGHIGEVLIYEWLKAKHPNLPASHIQHVSYQRGVDGNFERITGTPYDIVLEFGGQKYFIDVKTTIETIEELSESVAFFLSRREYKYIRDKQLDNYFIIRISLEDLNKNLGVKDLYEQISSRIDGLSFDDVLKRNHHLIENKCKEVLKKDVVVHQIQDHRLSFKVSIPFYGANSPF